MKLQLQSRHQRWRVDEAELARLLAGETLAITLDAGGRQLGFRLMLHEQQRASMDGQGDQLTLRLPRGAVEDYQQRLPCRDALAITAQDGGDRIDFEVDVRDSLRQRGPRRRGRDPE